MNFGDLKNKRDVAKWLIGVAAACIIIYLTIRYFNVAFAIFSRVLDVLYPLILGVGAAMIINVPMSFLERRIFPRLKNKKLLVIKRVLAIIVSVVFISGIFLGISLLVVPELIVTFKKIFDNMISLIEYFSKNDAQGMIAKMPIVKFINNLNIDWDALSVELQNWLKSVGIERWISDLGASFITTFINTIGIIVGGFINCFIGFIFSIYILFNKNKLKISAKRVVRAWFPKNSSSVIIHIFSVCSSTFKKFIAGQFAEAIILGTLCSIGMYILKLPYALMIGTLVGVLALVPIVGAFLGTFLGAFIIMIESPVSALVFIIYFLVLQQIEGNFIYPRVVGASLNLPAMWVLAAVTIGGNIGGPLGMFLSVPAAASAYQLFKEATIMREQRHKREFSERMKGKYGKNHANKNKNKNKQGSAVMLQNDMSKSKINATDDVVRVENSVANKQQLQSQENE